MFDYHLLQIDDRYVPDLDHLDRLTKSRMGGSRLAFQSTPGNWLRSIGVSRSRWLDHRQASWLISASVRTDMELSSLTVWSDLLYARQALSHCLMKSLWSEQESCLSRVRKDESVMTSCPRARTVLRAVELQPVDRPSPMAWASLKA